MAQGSLVRYIREQIRAGHDINSIKNYLLKYGYTQSAVNEALQEAYPPAEVRHVVHPSRMTIALVIAVVCSLVLIAAGIFMFAAPKSQLLDVQVDLASSSINYGENLKFTAQIFNLGKAKRYDVPLRYEIYNLKDELVKFKEETIALETRASSSASIELKDVQPGNYYLRVTASYGDKTAKATSSFRIVKSEIKTPEKEPAEEEQEPLIEKPQKSCPFSCDDNNKCTKDYCSESTGYGCMHDDILKCCGNGACEEGEDYNNCLADCAVPAEKEADIFGDKPVWDKVEMIKEIGKGDKEKAISYCNAIEQTGYKYDCFSGVAVSSNDNTLCENIIDESYKDGCYKDFATTNKNSEVCAKVAKDSKRDQCYMDFATKGDYTICDKLVNKYLKQSCDSLKKMSEVKVPSG